MHNPVKYWFLEFSLSCGHGFAVLLLFFLAVAVIGCGTNAGPVTMNGTAVPHLYGYDIPQVSKRLDQLGLGSFVIDHIARDSGGESIYIKESSPGKRIVILSLHEPPKVLSAPGDVSALNDHGEFVFWSDNVQEALNFKDGTTLKVYKPYGRFGIDPSGQFAFVETQQAKTEIFQLEKGRPEPLFTANVSCFRLFVEGKRFYMFSFNAKRPYSLLTQIYAEQGQGYVVVSDLTIADPSPGPAPFYLEDFDSASKKMLLVDVHDLPFQSQWYLFDLSTKELKKIGPARAYGLFLNDDVLRKCKQYDR